MSDAYHTEHLEHRGFAFRIEHHGDDTMEPPWERDCFHGPVRRSHTREDKRPGERILNRNRDRHDWVLLYDWQEAIKTAKRDGWGLPDDEMERGRKLFGREPTRGEIAAQAVSLDYERLCRWCNSDWSYIGVVAQFDLVDFEHPDGTIVGRTETFGDVDLLELADRSESLWGIEGDCTDYIDETARELCDQLLATLPDEIVMRGMMEREKCDA